VLHDGRVDEQLSGHTRFIQLLAMMNWHYLVISPMDDDSWACDLFDRLIILKPLVDEHSQRA